MAPYFRLGEAEARTVLARVEAARSHWRPTAVGAGLDREEIRRMAPAFEHEQAELARRFIEEAR